MKLGLDMLELKQIGKQHKQMVSYDQSPTTIWSNFGEICWLVLQPIPFSVSSLDPKPHILEVMRFNMIWVDSEQSTGIILFGGPNDRSAFFSWNFTASWNLSRLESKRLFVVPPSRPLVGCWSTMIIHDPHKILWEARRSHSTTSLQPKPGNWIKPKPKKKHGCQETSKHAVLICTPQSQAVMLLTILFSPHSRGQVVGFCLPPLDRKHSWQEQSHKLKTTSTLQTCTRQRACLGYPWFHTIRPMWNIGIPEYTSWIDHSFRRENTISFRISLGTNRSHRVPSVFPAKMFLPECPARNKCFQRDDISWADVHRAVNHTLNPET